MRLMLLALALAAGAVGGMTLAQHDDHGKGGDYVKLLSQKDIIEKLDGEARRLSAGGFRLAQTTADS